MVGLTLATGCAFATNLASILKHRGANHVPAFRFIGESVAFGLVVFGATFVSATTATAPAASRPPALA